MKARAVGLALLILSAVPAFGAQSRSAAARLEFKREHPCPSTGQRRGGCPGYVIDHVVPLCAGGPDRPSNMQWQTVAEGRVKDRQERRMCSSSSESAGRSSGARTTTLAP